MRRIVCLAAALVLAAGGAARADEKADLQKVIDKAIKAMGGEEKLAKYKAETYKMKGKFYGMGEGIDYTGEVSVQVPDKVRIQIDGDAGGMKVTFFIRVADGKKVWMKAFGQETKEITDKDELAEVKEANHEERVASLLPLKEKGYELASLGEVKVDNKPAIGMRVSHKGFRDVNLFFDKDSGLLVKREGTVKDFDMGGKEFMQETLLSDYKEVSGVKRPMKLLINRDGKKYVEGELTDVELKEKLDDSVFAKP
jgi:outer membrane lipoprotein-sorting protein